MRVLEVLVALVCAGALGTATRGILSLRRLTIRNRVDPSVRSAAPRWWLVSPSRPALLHRRLRAASLLVLATLTPAPAAPRRFGRRRDRREPSPLDRAGREIVVRAVALDRQVVAAAARRGAWRGRRLAELHREVAQLERAASRVVELTVDLRSHLERVGTPTADVLEDRLDGYEAALAELGVPRRHAAP